MPSSCSLICLLIMVKGSFTVNHVPLNIKFPLLCVVLAFILDL